MGQIDPFRVALALDQDPAAAVDTIVRELAAKGQGGSIGFIYATDKFKADLGTITEFLTAFQREIGFPISDCLYQITSTFM